MIEIITSIKNRIKDLEQTSSKLTEKQKYNVAVELEAADSIIKRMQLLCKVICKQ